jgi:hypothetical protein
VTTLPEYPEVYNIVNKLRVESVVAVEGVIQPRPVDAINADMKTGAIEVILGLIDNKLGDFSWLEFDKCTIYLEILLFIRSSLSLHFVCFGHGTCMGQGITYFI